MYNQIFKLEEREIAWLTEITMKYQSLTDCLTFTDWLTTKFWLADQVCLDDQAWLADQVWLIDWLS